MVKIKSDEYMNLHRIKSHLGPKRVFEIFEENGLNCLEDFKEYLVGSGADWEAFKEVEPYVDAFLGLRPAVDHAENETRDVVDASSGLDDKSFAVDVARKLPPAQRAAAFAMRRGKYEQARALIHKRLKEEVLARLD